MCIRQGHRSEGCRTEDKEPAEGTYPKIHHLRSSSTESRAQPPPAARLMDLAPLQPLFLPPDIMFCILTPPCSTEGAPRPPLLSVATRCHQLSSRKESPVYMYPLYISAEQLKTSRAFPLWGQQPILPWQRGSGPFSRTTVQEAAGIPPRGSGRCNPDCCGEAITLQGMRMQLAKALAYYSKNNQNVIAAQRCSGEGSFCAMTSLTLFEKKQNNPLMYFRHVQTTLPQHVPSMMCFLESPRSVSALQRKKQAHSC